MRPSAASLNVRLAAIGQPTVDRGEQEDPGVRFLLARRREDVRRLDDRLCPADQRIQDFLDSYFEGAAGTPRLPRRTLVLDEPGMARELSLPVDRDEYRSELLSSYRLLNGVLHNPANDRRTTAGVFHIAEGGLPIQEDKIAVDRDVASRIFAAAVEPPADSMRLPWTATMPGSAEAFVSLLLRPLVQPGVAGVITERRMETRFLVPGSLVANLDFVEAIFGNGGDPYLVESDASLDPDTWTGHTGFVLLAPHLTRLRKKDLGLPHVSEATERQQRDGQCWESADELYNAGSAFKLCVRDERGVIATVIADNYFGYCKKEVKTQISYAANLLGNAEEEHAGGAVVFPAYNLGPEWTNNRTPSDLSVSAAVERDPERFTMQPEGHATDRDWPHLTLVPAGAHYSMTHQSVTWRADGADRSIPLLAGSQYVAPDGYRVYAKHRELDRTQWHLVGVSPEPTHCHKPATVSGGGKSEISKSLLDAFVFSTTYTADFERDMDQVAALIDRDHRWRFRDPARNGTDRRSILGADRSLGSVIKLMTPSSRFTDEHNAYLRTIPYHVKELLFTVKRTYDPAWGEDWRSHFSVRRLNGRVGNQLLLDGQQVLANYLRVGFEQDGSWRLFSTRADFSPAVKVQTEDDITASTVVPAADVAERSVPQGLSSVKLVENCEQLLFQRPDDAIHRGYDKQTEDDMSRPGTFISNFAPLTHGDARAMRTRVQEYSQFTAPMAGLLDRAADMPDEDSPGYWACSAEPRIVDGRRTRNPRYLQVRPDLANPEESAAADLAVHLFYGVTTSVSVPVPVGVVAAGRRNNPAEPGVPPLCAYNPLHYMELPELLMEFISSMTGKSPSTTGAGSEGAMTKGPFNALPAVYDLNSALLSYALCGYDGWLSSAGYVGPKVRIDHDFSMLVPEVFSRMSTSERTAASLIENGFLEPVQDIEHDGVTIEASRLGFRMNEAFATTFFGRIFLHPDVVFPTEILQPETQDIDTFATSMATIVETHRRVAQAYFDDGTVDLAVPPLRALLEIMAFGRTADGRDRLDTAFRAAFTRESILASDWYAARLDAKQDADAALARRGVTNLERFTSAPANVAAVERVGLVERLEQMRARVEHVRSDDYRGGLVGTIGREPLRG